MTLGLNISHGSMLNVLHRDQIVTVMIIQMTAGVTRRQKRLVRVGHTRLVGDPAILGKPRPDGCHECVNGITPYNPFDEGTPD